MLYGRLVQRVFLMALLVTAAASVNAQIPPISVSAPKEEVNDEFLAYLLGIVHNNAELQTDGPTFLRAFPEFLPDKPSPIYDLAIFARTRTGLLTIGFVTPLRYPVPVDILGLHPVELQGSRVITLDEPVRVGQGVRRGVTAGLGLPREMTHLYVLALRNGYLRVNFSPWLDFLAGRIFDDADVKLVVIVRHEERWFALMAGLNPKDRPMVWVFDLRTSRFLVSPPRVLTRLGRSLVSDPP
jgi:hypothetical protein